MHLELEKWKVADIARLIILLPVERVPRKAGWRKREMRLRPSHRNAPSDRDMKTLRLAQENHRGEPNSYWREYFTEHAEQFPTVGVMIGPLREDGTFNTPERVPHALAAFRERAPFTGLYTRLEHDYDVERLEYMRALARENFILGQRQEGPYVDGLVYKRVDSLLQAEIDFCDAKLRFTRFILSQKDKSGPPKETKKEHWQALPPETTEAVALAYRHSGFHVRKIETTSRRWWEVIQ